MKRKFTSETYCLIYSIENKLNDDKYIGQTWQPLLVRFGDHKLIGNRCLKLFNAFNKHGRENFLINLLMITHSQEIANYWESYFINKFGSRIDRGLCYLSTPLAQNRSPTAVCRAS